MATSTAIGSSLAIRRSVSSLGQVSPFFLAMTSSTRRHSLILMFFFSNRMNSTMSSSLMEERLPLRCP